MLVLLIIFLITIPVVAHTVRVQLPKESNVPRESKPENVNIAVNKNGVIFWNELPMKNNADLLRRLEGVAGMKPQPEVHVRGDQDARYEGIGKVIITCQRAGITRLSFVIEPPVRGG
jgi:biopolymer transport protein ExbD